MSSPPYTDNSLMPVLTSSVKLATQSHSPPFCSETASLNSHPYNGRYFMALPTSTTAAAPQGWKRDPYRDSSTHELSRATFTRRLPSPTSTRRTSQACEKCRERKTKCSGEKPVCQRCINRGLICHYAGREPRVRGPAKPRASYQTHRKASISLDSALDASVFRVPPAIPRVSSMAQFSAHPSTSTRGFFNPDMMNATMQQTNQWSGASLNERRLPNRSLTSIDTHIANNSLNNPYLGQDGYLYDSLSESSGSEPTSAAESHFAQIDLPSRPLSQYSRSEYSYSPTYGPPHSFPSSPTLSATECILEMNLHQSETISTNLKDRGGRDAGIQVHYTDLRYPSPVVPIGFDAHLGVHEYMRMGEDGHDLGGRHVHAYGMGKESSYDHRFDAHSHARMSIHGTPGS